VIESSKKLALINFTNNVSDLNIVFNISNEIMHSSHCLILYPNIAFFDRESNNQMSFFQWLASLSNASNVVQAITPSVYSVAFWNVSHQKKSGNLFFKPISPPPLRGWGCF
jgi:hypothetical protein